MNTYLISRVFGSYDSNEGDGSSRKSDQLPAPEQQKKKE